MQSDSKISDLFVFSDFIPHAREIYRHAAVWILFLLEGITLGNMFCLSSKILYFQVP